MIIIPQADSFCTPPTKKSRYSMTRRESTNPRQSPLRRWAESGSVSSILVLVKALMNSHLVEPIRPPSVERERENESKIRIPKTIKALAAS